MQKMMRRHPILVSAIGLLAFLSLATASSAGLNEARGCGLSIEGDSTIVVGETATLKVVGEDGRPLDNSLVKWTLGTIEGQERIGLTDNGRSQTTVWMDAPPRMTDHERLAVFVEVRDGSKCGIRQGFKMLTVDTESAVVPWFEGISTVVNGSEEILPNTGDVVAFSPNFHLPEGWKVDFADVSPDSFVMPDADTTTVSVHLDAQLSGPNGQVVVFNQDQDLEQLRQKLQDIQDDLNNLEVRITMLELRLWALEFKIKELEGTANEMEKEFAEFMDQVMAWLADTPAFDDTDRGMVGWAQSQTNDDGDLTGVKVRIHRDFLTAKGKKVTRKKDDMGGTQENTITLKLVLVHELRHVWQYCQNAAADAAGDPRPFNTNDEFECDAQIWESKWGVPWPQPAVDQTTPGETTPGSGDGGGGGTTTPGSVSVVVTEAGEPAAGASVLFVKRAGAFDFIEDVNAPSVKSEDGEMAMAIADENGVARIDFMPEGPGVGTIEAVPIGSEEVNAIVDFVLMNETADCQPIFKSTQIIPGVPVCP